MLGPLYRLVDGRTEYKMAGGAAETPIKDVLGYPFNRSPVRRARSRPVPAGARGFRVGELAVAHESGALTRTSSPAVDLGEPRQRRRRCVGTRRAWRGLRRTACGQPRRRATPVTWIPQKGCYADTGQFSPHGQDEVRSSRRRRRGSGHPASRPAAAAGSTASSNKIVDPRHVVHLDRAPQLLAPGPRRPPARSPAAG